MKSSHSLKRNRNAFVTTFNKLFQNCTATGTVWNPCAETFPGAAEMSEPEAIAIVNYVRQLQQEGNLLYYFSFHSFSQMILIPYSHLSGSDVLEAHNYADLVRLLNNSFIPKF